MSVLGAYLKQTKVGKQGNFGKESMHEESDN
jgi:hypothetical protein